MLWTPYHIHLLIFLSARQVLQIDTSLQLLLNLDHLNSRLPGKLESGYVHGEQVDELKSDRKSTRLNSSHVSISYAVFCLKKKTNKTGSRYRGTSYRRK